MGMFFVLSAWTSAKVRPSRLALALVKKSKPVGGDTPREYDVRGDSMRGHFARQRLRPTHQGESQRIGKREVREGESTPEEALVMMRPQRRDSHIGHHAVGDRDQRKHHGLKLFCSTRPGLAREPA